MHRLTGISLMRTPLLRRLGAWLAVMAIGAHVLAMAMHHPVAAAALPDMTAALCIHSGEAPADALPLPDADGGPVHHAWFCPFCQALHAGAPLPQSGASVDAPLIPAGGPAAIAAPVPPPRLALGDLNPRGPPYPV
jgi:hypothetical protein